jgi:hypothetical protein
MGAAPETDFALVDDVEAIQRVRDAVSSREPFSLVRIGDGEAVVLTIDDSTWLQDLEYLHSHWGAERVSLGAVRRVQDDLRLALHSADLVGLRGDVVHTETPPDLLERSLAEIGAFVRSEFSVRATELERLSDRGARRLALVNRVMRGTEWPPEQHFCSAWIHWELLASGALTTILDELDEVVLVTSKPELEQLMARQFDVRVTVVPVPEKFVDAPVAGAHVPDRYSQMRDELRLPPGTVALVGAGIPGKAYCHWLKESDCVAIDVGAVLDAWVGKASRPLVLKSRFGVPGGSQVPEHFRLPIPQASNRRLQPRWKPRGIVR